MIADRGAPSAAAAADGHYAAAGAVADITY